MRMRMPTKAGGNAQVGNGHPRPQGRQQPQGVGRLQLDELPDGVEHLDADAGGGGGVCVDG